VGESVSRGPNPPCDGKAQIIELHYFGGLTQEEIAAVCEVHVNTVARDLRLGEAWLRSQLRART